MGEWKRQFQAPLGSGLGVHTTTDETLAGADLTGKVAIVTGGYTGIGLATVRALAKAGATVIVPARTPEKARKALAGLANVELETLDLFDPVSIDDFAQPFVDSGRALVLLIHIEEKPACAIAHSHPRTCCGRRRSSRPS